MGMYPYIYKGVYIYMYIYISSIGMESPRVGWTLKWTRIDQGL
jgi:hypothetical protein